MKLIRLKGKDAFFRLLAGTRSAQAALMVLQPGQSTGPPDNEHPQSEQWLFVVSGSGRARVGKRHVTLKERFLLLIEKRQLHQIRNTGHEPLVTLNFYTPPAYRANGEPRS